MCPSIVLNINPVGMTEDEVYAIRDKWIAEYEKYIRNNPVHEELGALLIDRAKRAAELCISRFVPTEEKKKPVRQGWADCDPAFYEEESERYCAENAAFDGDFPLGNEKDAEFAGDHFTMEQLVQMQFGETYTVKIDEDLAHDYDLILRKGFLAELCGRWNEAEKCYSQVDLGWRVSDREKACRKKKIIEGERAYGEAQHYMESGEWSRVFAPLNKAVTMENSDAMTDMGLARIYGTFGICTDFAEGMELLRSAAAASNARACMEIVELHDNGAAEIEGEEAKAMCEKAAGLGDKKAVSRLSDGFDTRPMIEILTEQADKGNADAMWWLYNSALKREYLDEAQMWYDKALEHGQVDALLAEANKYLCKETDTYNPSLAERHLRRAADKGSISAIVKLGSLTLKDGDEDFWLTAMRKEGTDLEVSADLSDRHKKQFAWIKLAAEAGDGNSMYNVAIAYYIGYPVQKDAKEAFHFAESASGEGNDSAMYLTARLLENGVGVAKDINRAIEYYTASAEQGVLPSMLRLYEIYRDGLEHIAPDQEKANRYLWMSGIGHS